MCQASEELSRAYELSQDFLDMLKERRAHALKDWIRAAKSSHITELKSFAKSVRAAIMRPFMLRAPCLGAKGKSKVRSSGSNVLKGKCMDGLSLISFASASSMPPSLVS
jgi:Transposase